MDAKTPKPQRDQEERERAALRHLTDTLAAEVGGEHSAADIARAVDSAVHRYDGATVREFVPIMVEREAREALRRAN